MERGKRAFTQLARPWPSGPDLSHHALEHDGLRRAQENKVRNGNSQQRVTDKQMRLRILRSSPAVQIRLNRPERLGTNRIAGAVVIVIEGGGWKLSPNLTGTAVRVRGNGRIDAYERHADIG